ncbi:hypothetical protein PoB_006829500 [Plakobranchus ocellatus]|uniref:Uncharacterized protein n=1 Tax=Plakobranchus ocellatus TaxID=259542 RepID=A0AAV4DCW9_9GAST|nr:hypothetical protein PoB_006829500 [Plakobranchus ocellatus]
MDRPPSRPPDTGQGKGKPPARSDRGTRQEKRDDADSSSNRRSKDIGGSNSLISQSPTSTSLDVLKASSIHPEERRLGDRSNRESSSSYKSLELDTGPGVAFDGKRTSVEERAALESSLKRNEDVDSGNRDRELDSGIGSRSDCQRLRAEFDSSTRTLDYSRRSIESDGSRKSLESPDSHGHWPVFSPPPPQVGSPEHAHQRHGGKKKRASSKGVTSSNQFEQHEPTDLVIPGPKAGEKRDKSSLKARSGSRSSKEGSLGDDRKETIASPESNMASMCSKNLSPINSTVSTPPMLYRRGLPSPQGPSSSTSPISPRQNSLLSSSEHRSAEPALHHRLEPYRDSLSWGENEKEYHSSSKSYSPGLEAGDLRGGRHAFARRSNSPSPPESSTRLGEETLLRHLKSSNPNFRERPSRLSGLVETTEIKRLERDEARGIRRLSDERRSPDFSPLDARIAGQDSTNDKLSWHLQNEEKPLLPISEEDKFLPPHIQGQTSGPARKHFRKFLIVSQAYLVSSVSCFNLSPLGAARWKQTGDYSEASDQSEPRRRGPSDSSVPRPDDEDDDADDNADDDNKDGLPSTVMATTAGVPSPGPALLLTWLGLAGPGHTDFTLSPALSANVAASKRRPRGRRNGGSRHRGTETYPRSSWPCHIDPQSW